MNNILFYKKKSNDKKRKFTTHQAGGFLSTQY